VAFCELGPTERESERESFVRQSFHTINKLSAEPTSVKRESGGGRRQTVRISTARAHTEVISAWLLPSFYLFFSVSNLLSHLCLSGAAESSCSLHSLSSLASPLLPPFYSSELLFRAFLSLGTAPQGAQYTTFRNSDPWMLADKSLSSEHPLHAQPARNPPTPDNAQLIRPLAVRLDTSCSSSCTCSSAEKPKELGVVYLHRMGTCVMYEEDDTCMQCVIGIPASHGHMCPHVCVCVCVCVCV